MRSADIAVIDYGMGNLLSVRRGLEHVGAKVCVTSDPELILTAPKVVLPGVGAFPDAMDELRRRGLVQVIQTVAHNRTPLLGICLGMQLLFESGQEFGYTAGLGLIPGCVAPIPATDANGDRLKIPHIGWNALQPAEGHQWEGTVLADIEPGEAAYFVHSFMAQPRDENRIASCYYGGMPIAAVVGSGKVIGCQFHPEKSGDMGLRILHSFMSI